MSAGADGEEPPWGAPPQHLQQPHPRQPLTSGNRGEENRRGRGEWAGVGRGVEERERRRARGRGRPTYQGPQYHSPGVGRGGTDVLPSLGTFEPSGDVRRGQRTTSDLSHSISQFSTPTLNPEAPSFVPSRALQRNFAYGAKTIQYAETPVVSGETEDGLRIRLTEELEREMYECMICCEKIHFAQRSWSCNQCYHVFHFRCIKTWASKSLGQEEGWRCPGCQNTTMLMPEECRCFCGKAVDPRPRRGDETAHSCGKRCGKLREGSGCPHPCVTLCHPGPCPSCPRTASIKCRCESTEQAFRCGAVNQFTCNKSCDLMLNCGVHKCSSGCHEGKCKSCSEKIFQFCYCEKTEREVMCTEADLCTMHFECGKKCGKALSCENHFCEKSCHFGDCGACPLSPTLVVNCPCGKSKLADIADSKRTACTDPIPLCADVCDKLLSCGSSDQPHKCESKCHSGQCPPCSKTSIRRCRCGAATKPIPCSELPNFDENNPVMCGFGCKKKKSCKQHKCGKLCCVDEEHICTQICGKKLSCGLHQCDRLCHTGKCPACLQAGFDELHCECGAEVRYPPVPCGTPRPSCHRPCSRQHSCTHPVGHTCHNFAECPPCTHLTRKRCYGNHEERRNIPCYLENISCGNRCGKELSCGMHECRKQCHSGECQLGGEKCLQPCALPRTDCNHPCGAPCHKDSPCPSGPCKYEVEVRCKCERLKAKLSCSQVDRQWNMLLANSAMGGKSSSSADLQSLQSPEKLRCLPCDGDCARIERNRVLAAALNIVDPELRPDKHTPTYSDFLKVQFELMPSFLTSIERILVQLVNHCNQSAEKMQTHGFTPMKNEHRRVIHEYAEHFLIETQSFDPEPLRNVVATAKRGKCRIPTTLLSVCMKPAMEKPKGMRRILPPTTPVKNHWEDE